MNEQKLNELLERKKNISVNFPGSESEFADDFFARIALPPSGSAVSKRVHLLRFAAAILLTVSLSAIFLPLLRKERSANDPYMKLKEAVRIFGSDAAVLFVNDELYTGERSAAHPENQVCLTFRRENGTRIQLLLACSDNDTIRLDMPDISGEIVTSRCGKEKLMLDMDIVLNGKRIRLYAPVTQKKHDQYTGDEIV